MTRIKLTVEYDGTRYVGWQIQPNGRSLQASLQQALAELLGETVSVQASGRTDAGVHAEGQVVCFDSPRSLPLKAYWMGLNRLLPEDIAVVGAEEAASDFDPRRWARGKRYRYQVLNHRSRSPLRRHTHWSVFQPLDLDAMRKGAEPLVGRHDFSAFRAADCQAKHPVRQLFRLAIEGQQGGEITFTVEGTAFLKHMVRNLVGSLVEVGRGRHPPEWIGEVLLSLDRTRAGPTAPAHGLTLMEVFYGFAPGGELADDSEA